MLATSLLFETVFLTSFSIVDEWRCVVLVGKNRGSFGEQWGDDKTFSGAMGASFIFPIVAPLFFVMSVEVGTRFSSTTLTAPNEESTQDFRGVTIVIPGPGGAWGRKNIRRSRRLFTQASPAVGTA